MTVVVDLFAGPGGWEEGLRLVAPDRLRDVVGIELDASAARTAAANGHLRVETDVRAMRFSFWEHDVDGLIASPPCPGFSSAGKGGGRRDLPKILDAIETVAKIVGGDRSKATDELTALIRRLEDTQEDERSSLVLEPLLWVLLYRPRWVALEQVPSVIPVWNAMSDVLRAMGYSVATAVVSAERYGVPQTRKRAVLLAQRDREVSIPSPSHASYPRKAADGMLLPDAVSMADALGWGMTSRPYPTLTAGTSAGGQDPAMVGGSGGREAIQREADAGRWRFAGAGKTAQTTSGQRPREMDEPAHTITGKGTAAWVAQSGTRPWDKADPQSHRVTVREAAILQTFPAEYVWAGTQTAQYQQIGNAVPPLLAAAILEELI